jgi:hypothetical protein
MKKNSDTKTRVSPMVTGSLYNFFFYPFIILPFGEESFYLLPFIFNL